MMPPEEYDFDYPEEDDFMEDDEALEVLRELENQKEVVPPEPVSKKPRLATPPPLSSPAKKILEDVTNFTDAVKQDEAAVYKIPRLGDRKVYRKVPLQGEYQTFTMNDGERFYVKVSNEDDNDDDGITVDRKRATYSGLLGQPYELLLEQAIQEQMRIEQSSLASLVANEDSGIESSTEDEASKAEAALWVEKFKPRSYMQLLSDDGTNRTLLQWLKLWDKLVFGKEVKQSKPDSSGGGGDGNEHKKFSNNEIIAELDDTQRPQQKTALLYGCPGLGKTTLAHVVATHAGYNVVEMNASDDRSLAAFKNKLEAATQMKSVSNADQRPNCLIIDEIDGAPAATVNYLVGLLKGSQKTKKKAATMLQRPVICICNDLYVPALRPLRQMSLLLPFPETSSQRLAQRLAFISASENLKTDMSALLALCDKSQNDIRSCLSTLQFFKSKGQKMSAADVSKTFVGNKDTQKSHFAVWQDLFTIPRPVKRRLNEDIAAKVVDNKQNVLKSVMACGDYDKLQQGVFENYLGVKFKDSRFHNIMAGQDWFCFFDTINQHIMRSQHYAMMAYMPYNFVAAHALFAAHGRVKVAYPSTANEVKNQLLKANQIVESLYSEMSPGARCFSSPSVLIRDVLPCLLEIIKPNLRPVNTQLYNKSEKDLLKTLIAVFVTYSLNYVQEKSQDGQYTYKLDPNVEEVALFPDIQHAQLPYAIKQMIAHEVIKEKMRRSEPVAIPEPEKPAKAEKELPNHMKQKLEAKKVEVKEHVPVDFFGRRIEAKPEDEAKNVSIISLGVIYKFKEGYNNAVRKTIRMKELL